LFEAKQYWKMKVTVLAPLAHTGFKAHYAPEMILIYFSKACYWWPVITSKKLLNGQLSEPTFASAVAF
jgi:hypothetical protein